MIPSRLYLTGFMGSGKSTVGPLLARRLDYDFLDLDDVVEAAAGLSVAALFRDEGEEVFRRLEADALHATAAREGLVVALGGGTLAEGDNLRFARSHGCVVYLRVPVAELVRRLHPGQAGRPLLLDDDGRMRSEATLRSYVAALLAHRSRAYEGAELTVAADAPPDEVAAKIVEALEAEAG